MRLQVRPENSSARSAFLRRLGLDGVLCVLTRRLAGVLSHSSVQTKQELNEFSCVVLARNITPMLFYVQLITLYEALRLRASVFTGRA